MRYYSDFAYQRLNGSLLHLTAVLACLLFVWHFGTNGLTRVPLANHDELRTLSHIFGRSVSSPQSLQATVDNVAENSQQHGPLYFIILNLWSRIAGSDLFVLRLLSTYFALLSVAAVYRLALITRRRDIALATLFIISINALFLFYSRELRMYSLLPFFAAWIVCCYWRLLKTSGRINWRLWLMLAIGCGLILYLHYFGIFILAAVAIYQLLFARKNLRWIHISLAMIVGGLLFVPWAPTVFMGLEGFSNKSMIGMNAVESLVSFANVYGNDFWMLPLGALLIVFCYRKQMGKPQRFILIFTFLLIAVMLLANEINPILLPKRLRYLLLAAPLLGSALAIAWDSLPKRAPVQFLLVAVWILSFITYSHNEKSYVASKRKSLESLYAPPYYSLVYAANIEVQASDSLLSLHPSRKITWVTGDYYQKLIQASNLVHIYYDGGGRLTIQTTKQPLSSLDDFVSKYAAFWLLYDPQETDEGSMGDIFGWARNYYRSCGKYIEETEAVVERYVRDSDPC